MTLCSLLSQNIGSKDFFQKGGTAGTIVSNALLQGTISEATGGKFANGAMSAAFRVAFNDTFEEKFNRWFDAKMSGNEGDLAQAPNDAEMHMAALSEYAEKVTSPLDTSADLIGDAILSRSKISGTADLFIGLGGAAVDVTRYEGCTVVSFCTQYGIGLQVGASYSGDVSLSSAPHFFSSESIGIFGDFGLGGTIGVSYDYGLTNGESVLKFDRGYGYGKASGIQYCFNAANSCNN